MSFKCTLLVEWHVNRGIGLLFTVNVSSFNICRLIKDKGKAIQDQTH